MPGLLDMAQIPLPAAVVVPDYATLRLAWLTRYAALREVEVSELNLNDPAVQLCEAGAYLEMLRLSSVNDSVRNTMLASASGYGLDNLGADPLYGTTLRLVVDPGDDEAVPPVPPTYETDDDYRARLSLAPAALSVAGPSGAYESIARGVTGVLDVDVTSPDPCEVLVEILVHPDNSAVGVNVLAALTPDSVRPIGDRVTVQDALKEASTAAVTVYVPDGPNLLAVQAASQARVDALLIPLCKKVRSGAQLAEGGDNFAWLGGCVVQGVRSWEVTAHTGMSDTTHAWWPMTVTVTAVRSNA